MEPLDAFDGHLRRIAEAATRFTPRLVAVRPGLDAGRRVVVVETDIGSSALFLRLVARMEAFCRDAAIPPDYLFSYRRPPPGLPPPGPSPDDLPTVWPPDIV